MTAKRYPASEITPHGWYMLTAGNQPSVWLDAYDGSIRFDLMGGLAIPDRYTAPECAQIKRGGLKGLVPPWKHIDQKGATEDGVTNIDSLYDPAEPQLDIRCRGRDGRHVQRVVRDLIASIDAKQPSKLNFLSADEGHWWGTPRWFQGAPPNPVMGGQAGYQDLSLRLRIDGAFYRTYDDTTSFDFDYDSMVDRFNFTDTADLGVNWPLHFYEGAGGGYPAADGSEATWVESGTTERGVVAGPYKDFVTDTDNQVVEIELGTIPEVFYRYGAYNDIWGRMSVNLDGTWKGDGIRARIGMRPGPFFGFPTGFVELSRFNNFVETSLFSEDIVFWPSYGEKFSLICGVADNPRLFRIKRNGAPVLSHKEVGTGSLVGAAYRGVGFGMKAGDGDDSQMSPAWVQKISAGDNAAVTQSGFLACNNVGDQKMYRDHIFFGPGTVRIWDGPGAGPEEFVEFGPLAKNQVAMLRTDPRDRNVYDLTVVPAAPGQQEQSIFDIAYNAFLSFANAVNLTPILSVIQSIFGIFGGGPSPVPPQGNFYSLLTGRFSDRSAIPAKSPGNPVSPYHVKVEMRGGDADSKIISSGTPLRRWPL